MHIHFVDRSAARTRLLPFTYTRPISDLRVGILRISEKWISYFPGSYSYITADHLASKFPSINHNGIYVFDGLLPNSSLIEQVKNLRPGQALFDHDTILVSTLPDYKSTEKIQCESCSRIVYPWDIFRLNAEEIKKDFKLITSGRESAPLQDPHTKAYGEDIFIEEGAVVKAAILNAEKGPIYIGKNAEIGEGSMIRGSFALCENSVLSMGAKIKGDTTIGPYSKAGGEISNCVFWGYSNKGHDGFLGNSVVGQWCNLGADTNNSNLKNNYANVKMWDFESKRFKDTGLQFCGLLMGDHSKCGINTMFNTGTTVGVSANIFGEGFPRTIIPSFAWGGSSGFMTYKLNKVFETAELVMKRRGLELDEVERSILQHVFEETTDYRAWDKKG